MFNITLTENLIQKLNTILPVSVFSETSKIKIYPLRINENEEAKLEFEYFCGNRRDAEELVQIFIISMNLKNTNA